MSTAKLFAAFLVGTALLGIAFARVTLADATTSTSALTGTVTSQADGPMEGVLIGAKRDGLDDQHLGRQQRAGPVQLPARPDGTGPLRDQHPRRRLRAARDLSRSEGRQPARLDLPLTKITRPTEDRGRRCRTRS